jgi:TRAP-type mannitol/chloroaromatic compound transport system substrate-binding protein
MDRRDFLKSSSLAASAVTVGGASAAVAAGNVAAAAGGMPVAAGAGAQPFVLAVPQSLAHIEVMTAAHRIAARLQTLFEGRRYVTVETTVEGGLEAVQTARADAYLGLESQHASHHAAFQLISGLPYGTELAPMMQQAWLTTGEGRDLWLALSAEHGAVAFPAFHTGLSAGLYAETILEQSGDLSGKRIAARGLAADVVRALGATAVAFSDADLKGAISAAALDAAEPLMAPTTAVAHWSFAPGLTPAGHLMTLGLRHSTWERLSPSERIGFEGVAAETLMQSHGAAQMLAATAQRIDAWRRWPVHTTFSATLQRDLQEAGRDVLASLGQRDATTRRLVGSLEQFRNGVTSEPWLAPAALPSLVA